MPIATRRDARHLRFYGPFFSPYFCILYCIFSVTDIHRNEANTVDSGNRFDGYSSEPTTGSPRSVQRINERTRDKMANRVQQRHARKGHQHQTPRYLQYAVSSMSSRGIHSSAGLRLERLVAWRSTSLSTRSRLPPTSFLMSELGHLRSLVSSANSSG